MGVPGVSARSLLEEVRGLLGDLHVPEPGTVDVETDLGTYGLDSLAKVELQDRLEHRFSVTLPDEVLATARTAADWLRAVRAAQGRPPSAPWPAADRPIARAPGQGWPETADTLAAAFAWHLATHPELPCVSIWDTGEEPPVTLCYRQLAIGAGAVTASLLEFGVAHGDRVALMLPTGTDYFVTFLGVLLAGAVPVPLYPAPPGVPVEEHLGRHASLLDHAGARLLVTTTDTHLGAPGLAAVPSLRVVAPKELLTRTGPSGAGVAPIGPDDVGLIQYTSGSTGDPKGVVLTHGQLLANIRAMGGAARVSTADVFVSWLPLYHDMGLIGAWLAPFYFGLPLVVLPPLAFLARPVRWFEAISAFRGTLSAGPNAAYRLCVDHIDEAELDGIDLSSWRIAFNGSEPVDAGTVQRFAERFSAHGFDARAMCPAYGLAELGVGAAFSPLDQGPLVDRIARDPLARSHRAVPAAPGDRRALAVVSCGQALPGYTFRVVDDQGREVADRIEGTIECRGPSATAGYLANDQATADLWHDGWLETGDLGYLADGNLFLTGRAKDVIIRGGRNLHPEDLEQAVGGLPGLDPAAVAAFACTDPSGGPDRLVVAVETDPRSAEQAAELATRIRGRITELFSMAPDRVLLVDPGALVRAANGKVRRAATRDAFEAGSLVAAGAAAPLSRPRLVSSTTRPGRRRLGRRVGAGCFALWVWLLLALIAAPLWLALQLPLPLPVRWRLARGAARLILMSSGVSLGVHPDTDALLSAGDSAVVVANHHSIVDGLVLLIISRRPLVFVSSTDLEHQLVLGHLLRRLGCLFVERGSARHGEEAVERLVTTLQAGRPLVMFPEGSVRGQPGLRSFHLGPFEAAVRASTPVVPVGIRGTRQVWPPGSRLPRLGSIEVSIGASIPPKGNDFVSAVQLRDDARRAIAGLAREPVVC